MISWLQSTLQRHYKWLFSIMLVIIVISFVFTIGASPGISTGHSSKKTNYYGYNITNRQVQQILGKKVLISQYLDSGNFNPNASLIQSLIFSRPPLLALAESLQIPNPTDNELSTFIRSKAAFRAPSGNFDKLKYENFLNQLQHNPELNEVLVKETLCEDFKIEKVINALSNPTVVLPFEAELSIDRQNTIYSVELASLSTTSFPKNRVVTEEKLEEYYNKFKTQYAQPAQISVAFLELKAENFLDQVKDNNEDKLAAAQKIAEKKIHDFLYEIYEQDIKRNSSKFRDILAKYNFTLQKLPAFAVNTTPSFKNIPESLAIQAPSLTESHYYSDVVSKDNSSFVLFFNARKESTIPELSKIADKLKNRIQDDENIALLESKAKIIDNTFKKAIADGKSFQELAKAQGMTVKTFDDFKIGHAPESFPRLVLEQILMLKEKETSPALLSNDLVQVAYVKKKILQKTNESAEEIEKLLKQLRLWTGMASAQATVNEMVDNGLKKLPEQG